MEEQGLFRRRKLPHIDVDNCPFFITACLHDSISAAGLSRIRQYRQVLDARPTPEDLTEGEWEAKKHKLLFKLVDELLDGEPAKRDLADPRLAKAVQNAFLHFANERYTLWGFVVMPSHHHWFFQPLSQWVEQLSRSREAGGKPRTPRESISHSIQSFTAIQCNRILGKTGPFWQTETFDHYARNEAEVCRIIQYIENNPVKAGLVEQPFQWQWSSAAIRHQLQLAPHAPIPKPAHS